MSAILTNRSTLAVFPLPTDTLFLPSNHHTTTSSSSSYRSSSRFFPRNSPLLALEASLPAHTKAQIWDRAVTRASLGLKWGKRKNPKRLCVNSAIVEEEVEGGSIFHVFSRAL
ncbi:MAG: hypothetical protein LQ343_001107 [Gyalolechia ehrenbergii]|nr:MAG: hypothetical protein LQ343_001107 [Gyalolechia ehrenbergii]